MDTIEFIKEFQNAHPLDQPVSFLDKASDLFRGILRLLKHRKLGA